MQVINWMALVSIIMPTYNSGQYIAESIESVLNQTERDWELEIIDDGSTDGTFEIVLPYIKKYPNIHYCYFTANRGPSAARTEAIRRAGGKYIAFLDSDDLWLPEKLKKQICFMRENDCPFSCTAYSCMNETGDKKEYAIYPLHRTDYRKMFIFSNPLGNLTVMYDQSKLGKYTVPEIRKRNDFALWLRILKDTPCCRGLQDVLAVYRKRSGSVSSNKRTLIGYHWYLYRNIEELSAFQSVICILCWILVKGTGIGIHRKRLR